MRRNDRLKWSTKRRAHERSNNNRSGLDHPDEETKILNIQSVLAH